MFGLDERVVDLSHGGALGFVLLVAILLGVRHASDPDHVAAMTTLFASGREHARRAVGWLGVSWGLGHGVTLMAFGIPVVVFGAQIPSAAQRACEIVVAVLLVFLAVRLIVRWRRKRTHAAAPTRSVRAAFGIGLVHGIGGSAGASVLVLASVESQVVAVVALGLLALFTIPSMALITTGFGAALVQRPVQARMEALTPVLGALTLGFGLWYGAGAIEPGFYPF